MRSMRPSNLMSLQFVTRRRRPLMAGVVEKSAYVELSAAEDAKYTEALTGILELGDEVATLHRA